LFHSHWIHTMLRCVTLACVIAATSALTAPLSAHAQQQRVFPATALRGELRIQQPPEVTLNGRPARLAPGARIRGADNLLQMSGALAGQALTVHYTRDDYELLRDVWILTPAERARQPWPATPAEAAAWRFDPVGQTWSR
jgi:hypothetical protein